MELTGRADVACGLEHGIQTVIGDDLCDIIHTGVLIGIIMLIQQQEEEESDLLRVVAVHKIKGSAELVHADHHVRRGPVSVDRSSCRSGFLQ